MFSAKKTKTQIQNPQQKSEPAPIFTKIQQFNAERGLRFPNPSYGNKKALPNCKNLFRSQPGNHQHGHICQLPPVSELWLGLKNKSLGHCHWENHQLLPHPEHAELC